METAERDRWTYEEYRKLPDDGRRYEIIEGELLVSPSPTTKHQRASFMIAHLLEIHVRDRGLGWCSAPSPDVILTKNSVVQPDAVFVSAGRKETVAAHGITGGPDLVVEVLSESTRKRDYTAKLQLYAKHGVREYWIVDPEIERVEIFVLEEGKLSKKGEVIEGDVRSLAVLPDLRIPLARIFD
jgi:Uma2 family endonuclease